MRRKIIALTAAAAAAVSFGSALSAYAANDKPVFFMSMKADESTAFISDDGENGVYKEMKSSNGAVVKAVVIDGSTYLPFRFVSELAGWNQGQVPASGGGSNNTFEFINNGNGGILRIRTGNQTYIREVGKPFDYELKIDGKAEKRTFELRNLDGSLYMPLRYIADLMGAKADYDSKDGNIYFASSLSVMNTFVNQADKALKFEKTMSNGYKYYDNPSMYSDMYLHSNGTTRSTVASDLNVSDYTYSCVSRCNKNLYYINDRDLKVYTKREDDTKDRRMYFVNVKNQTEDFYANMLLTDGEYLWGIASDKEDEAQGSVFRADFDGSNFEYVMGAEDCYNLLFREHNGEKYVFYMYSDYQSLLRVVPHTIDQFGVAIVGDDGNFAIGKAALLTFSDNAVIYLNAEDGRIHYLPYTGDIYTQERVYADTSKEKIITEYSKQDIGKIMSMNYDTDNNILYFTAQIDGGAALYYYDCENDTVGRLRTSKEEKTRVSIIPTSRDTYVVNCDGDKKNEVTVSTANGEITIAGEHKLAR